MKPPQKAENPFDIINLVLTYAGIAHVLNFLDLHPDGLRELSEVNIAGCLFGSSD